MDKPTKVKWVDELERADELTEPLGVQWVVVTPELSAQEVREFQTEDPDLGPLFDWLTAEQTPSADNLRQPSLESRNLWRQCPAVHLSDAVLVRRLYDSDAVQMVVPHRLRKPLFDQSHSGLQDLRDRSPLLVEYRREWSSSPRWSRRMSAREP